MSAQYLSVTSWSTGDRAGATGAMLCAIHCALTPLVAGLLPVVGLGILLTEGVERILLFGSLPVSCLVLIAASHRKASAAALLPFVAGATPVQASGDRAARGAAVWTSFVASTESSCRSSRSSPPFDDYAVEAFELNAIDYLLKPVQLERLLATLDRARDRLRQPEPADVRAASLATAAAAYEQAARRQSLERIPVRSRDEVVILPVRHIASIVTDGEFLHITTTRSERYTITHRLHALQARLDPRRFVRQGRGTLANLELIARVSPMPGGT